MHLLVPEKDVRLYRAHMTREDVAKDLVCHLSPKDAQSLNVKETDMVKIKTDFGVAIADPVIDEGVPEGVLIVPFHPKAIKLIGVSTTGTLQIDDHHIKAEISIETRKK